MKSSSTLPTLFFLSLSRTSFQSCQASPATLSPGKNKIRNQDRHRDLQTLIAEFDGQVERAFLGRSVAISGNRKVVAAGAPRTYGVFPPAYDTTGFVRIFEEVNGSFIQKGNDIEGASGNSYYGGAGVELSWDGSVVIAVQRTFFWQVFEFVDGDWQQLGNTVEVNSTATSLSMSADGHAVAFKVTDLQGGDEVYIYDYDEGSNSWSQRGAAIVGDHGLGRGLSISEDGLTVAATAPFGNCDCVYETGYAKVFKFVGGAWTQIGSDICGEDSGDRLEAVDIDSSGTVIALGAAANDGDNGEDSGHVRIFKLQDGEWVQQGQDIDGEAAWDYSGETVSLSGDGLVVAIGSRYHNNDAGQTRVYRFDDGIWKKVQSDIEGVAPKDYSGNDVALSGDGSTLVVGAPGYNGTKGSELVGQLLLFQLDLTELSTPSPTGAPTSVPTGVPTGAPTGALAGAPTESSGNAHVRTWVGRHIAVTMFLNGFWLMHGM
eukprot:scaffold92_cov85-Cylindrotheca_fusiformis.AAC.4